MQCLRRGREGRRGAALVAILALTGAVAGCGGTGDAAPSPPVRVGLLYPTSGPAGTYGVDEQRGAMLAVDWVNAHGGLRGRSLEAVTVSADRPEAVPAAMDALQKAGVSIVIGTNASAISAVAADEATRRHLLLWETGAVGLTDAGVTGGTNFIRMAPMGANLGKEAVDFVRDGLAPKLPAHVGPLKWAVAYVDDVYGRAVGRGAVDEVSATRQPMAGVFPYTVAGIDYPALAARIAAAHPDVLFVSSYLDDAIALRRALVAAKVPLLANLGTSSSYCWPAFGARLQADAVGLFASDKPDAGSVQVGALSAEGRDSLAWVAPRYVARYHVEMSSHALSGFSNAYALVARVLSAAPTAKVPDVAATARSIKLPVGTLANGGGLDIAPLGAPDAGNNRNAASVIWEWVAPGERAVVWPPAFATHPVVAIAIDR